MSLTGPSRTIIVEPLKAPTQVPLPAPVKPGPPAPQPART
jgi:hypothetical protein